MSTRVVEPASKRSSLFWVAGLLPVGGLIWSYWPTLAELWLFWQRNQDYSVGQLVPLVAVYLVWADRKKLKELPSRVCWWGLFGLMAAQIVRFAGLYYDYVSLERYSFVLTVASLCWLLFGPSVLRRCGWVFLFLLLIVPLPGRVHNAVTLPLQGFATGAAAFILELLGYWVVQKGHVLHVNESTQAAVAEACNGLRMLTAFIFVGAVLAFLVKRSRWQKGVVVLSSIPIAILANTVRLIVTVILFDSVSSELADKFFHDFAGLAMMPIAILFVVTELWLLRWLSGGAERKQAAPLGAPKAKALERAANPARRQRAAVASRT